jgi:ectoine hydroxylase-related dioxygenase (phytanoyl-CoA dioxygenase family)
VTAVSGARNDGQATRFPAVLLDEEAEAALVAHGFAVLPGLAVADLPWLRPLAVEALGGDDRHGEQPASVEQGRPWERQLAPGETWRIGVNDATTEERDRYEVRLAAWWDQVLVERFVDHRVLFTSFLTKHPGDDSTLPMHQDPSVVDEREHRSVTLWIALDDMGPELQNGELHVIPGSHAVGQEWRGTRTMATYLPEVDRVWPSARSVAVRAGDGIVLDSRVVHGSPPNFGTSSRIAMAGVVVPRGVPLQHVLAADGDADEVVIHRVDDDFYRHVSPRSLHESPPEDLEVLEVVPRVLAPITADGLIASARTPVLRDEAADLELATAGYAIVPLFDADEVAEIRARCRAGLARPDEPGPMAFDYMQEDRGAMRRVEDLLAPVWEQHLPELFADHEVVFSTFVLKPPGHGSGMFLHDDRTFVDEEQHRAFTVWVPLVDVSPELDNGTLYLVPGSHRIMPAASGTGTPDWIRPYERYLERFLQPVRMRAGEALVYDTKTLHGSTANLTDTTREAIATAIAPRGAELIHVVADGPQRQVHVVDHDFFLDVHPNDIAAHGMPERYPRTRSYEEHLLEADPVAIARVCDPGEVPVPERGIDDPPPSMRGIEPFGPSEEAAPADVPPAPIEPEATPAATGRRRWWRR